MAVVGEARVRLTGDASRLNRALKNAGRSLDRFADRAGQLGKTLTTRLTLPLSLIGGVAVKQFASFDFQMRRVQAVTQATGERFQEMTKLALELGRTTQFTAKQAATAMTSLAVAGFDATEAMRALPGVLQLAGAGAVTLEEAADTASKILRGFSFDVEEISRVNDVLAKTFISSNTTLSTLNESFKLVSPVAAAAGLEFEEVAAALGRLGDKGLQGSRAGAGLARVISVLLGPTKQQAERLDELGISTVDATGNMRPLADILGQLQDAMEDAGGGAEAVGKLFRIFGDQGGRVMAALLSVGQGALEEYTEELRNAGGTAAEVEKVQFAGIQGALVKLKSAVEGASISFGKALAPAVEKVLEVIRKLAQSFSELPPSIQKNIAIFATVVAAIGPVLLAIKGLSLLIGGLALLFSPAGALFVGLVALAALLLKSSGAFDKTKKSAREAGTALEDFTKAQLKATLAEINTERIKLNIELERQRVAALNPMIPLLEAEEEKRKRIETLEKSLKTLAEDRLKLLKESSRQFAERREEVEDIEDDFETQEEIDALLKQIAERDARRAEAKKKRDDAAAKAAKKTAVAVRSTADVLKELQDELNKASLLAKVLGKDFDGAEAATRAIENALEDLAEIGTPKAQKAMQSLVVQLKMWKKESKDTSEIMSNAFKDIKDAIRTSVDGVIRGTTSLQSAFSNLVDSILLKFQERAITGVLDALEKKLTDVAQAALEAKNKTGGAVKAGGFRDTLNKVFGVKTKPDEPDSQSEKLAAAADKLGETAPPIKEAAAAVKAGAEKIVSSQEVVKSTAEASRVAVQASSQTVTTAGQGLMNAASQLSTAAVDLKLAAEKMGQGGPGQPAVPLGGVGDIVGSGGGAVGDVVATITGVEKLGQSSAAAAASLEGTAAASTQATGGFGGFLQGLSSATTGLGNFLGNLFKGGSGGGGGFLDILKFIPAIFAKKGGVVGKTDFPSRIVPLNAFANARRMQFGGTAGLKAGEFPTILHRGETVTPAGESGPGSVTVNFNVTTPDAGSFMRSEGQLTAQAARMIQRARRNL